MSDEPSLRDGLVLAFSIQALGLVASAESRLAAFAVHSLPIENGGVLAEAAPVAPLVQNARRGLP